MYFMGLQKSRTNLATEQHCQQIQIKGRLCFVLFRVLPRVVHHLENHHGNTFHGIWPIQYICISWHFQLEATDFIMSSSVIMTKHLDIEIYFRPLDFCTFENFPAKTQGRFDANVVINHLSGRLNKSISCLFYSFIV